MEIRDFLGRLSVALLRRRAATSPAPSERPIRNSLANVPLRPRQLPPHKPRPPSRPASNM